MNEIIIDASNSVLGRVASLAAKQALLGKDVIIINCNNALISGRKNFIVKQYKQKRSRGWYALKGPNFPKSPERILKRTIRGMLHYTHGTGRLAFKRIKCFNDIPHEYAHKKPDIKTEKTLNTKSLTLKQLSEIV